MEFSRQECWSGYPFPSLGDLPNPGIKARSPTLHADSWPAEPPGKLQFSSVQFSHSIMSDSLWPHGPQHARLPCPSPSPGACSNSCWLSQWCHPTISSSVIPFFSSLQSFPASGSFPKSWLSTSGGQSIGASASASVLPMNIQGWFLLELIGLIFLLFKILARVLQHHNSKASIPRRSAFLVVQLSHPYMTTEKAHSFDYMGLCWQSDVSAF